MSFQVIPALDVHRGRLARIEDVRPVPVGAFGGDPVAAAEAFAAAGARLVHVVDLDLAFSGRPGNLEVVGRVAALGLRVQASGGLSSEEEVAAVLEAGAWRAVLGSAALAVRPLAERLIAGHGERLAVGLEVEGDAIRPRGRHADVSLGLDEAVDWLVGAGAARFVVTDVGRAGGLGGPDLERLGRVARRAVRPVIASGGIASLGDLQAVAGLAPAVEGAIVGRALLEGGLDLGEAIRAVGGGGPEEPGR